MAHCKKTALFIGRFQPFHNGHYSTILQIKDNGFDEIIIGVGSSQLSGTEENPFSAEDRKEMIETTLSNHRDLNYRIIFIPDTNDDDLWMESIEKILKENHVDKPIVVYTNNPLVKRLFERAGYEVVGPKLLKSGGETVSGTIIRRMMRVNDKSWRELVPKEVYEKLASKEVNN